MASTPRANCSTSSCSRIQDTPRARPTQGGLAYVEQHTEYNSPGKRLHVVVRSFPEYAQQWFEKPVAHTHGRNTQRPSTCPLMCIATVENANIINNNDDALIHRPLTQGCSFVPFYAVSVGPVESALSILLFGALVLRKHVSRACTKRVIPRYA